MQEVDHDDAADAAQPQLAGDLGRRFHIYLQRHLVEIAATGGTAAGIDVDGGQRLGLAENDRAAGRQLDPAGTRMGDVVLRSEEHTSDLQSPMSISYAVFCLK